MSCKIQKVVNLIALASGAVSLAVVGSGLFIYVNRDKLVDNVKSQVLKSVSGSLPSLVDSKLPELPAMTGGVNPSPGKAAAQQGLAIPKF
tara:strand:- start:2679 stop:2948 length:270 start_codon:yes stop_codon:yes gene_type:complete